MILRMVLLGIAVAMAGLAGDAQAQVPVLGGVVGRNGYFGRNGYYNERNAYFNAYNSGYYNGYGQGYYGGYGGPIRDGYSTFGTGPYGYGGGSEHHFENNGFYNGYGYAGTYGNTYFPYFHSIGGPIF